MNRIEARRRLVETYEKTGSIRETMRQWRTSRQVVRKWGRRHREEGEAGLRDRSRRPRHSPRCTSPEVEREVPEAWKETGYGRHRLAFYLTQRGLKISPHRRRGILPPLPAPDPYRSGIPRLRPAVGLLLQCPPSPHLGHDQYRPAPRLRLGGG